jgi:2-dehydro-3-deoxygluconokinase
VTRPAALLFMGEPMLELNQRPRAADGTRLYLEGHGGDTSNAAIAAARQGAQAGYVSAIGHDHAGDSLMALWAREGVDVSTVRRSPTHPTGVYIVTHGPDGHRFQYHRAGSAAAAMCPDDLPLDAIRAARVLYASGISQGISASAADAVFAAIDAARDAGVLVAYDTNYRPALWPPARAAAIIHAAIARADFAFPGLEDARALTGLDDPDAIAAFYVGLGARIVVLKMGATGALLAEGTRRVRIPRHAVETVDATGAGDTFCGSFLARIVAGDDAEQAARYASVAAALACTGYGAVAPIPTADAVRAAMGTAGMSAGGGGGRSGGGLNAPAA